MRRQKVEDAWQVYERLVAGIKNRKEVIPVATKKKAKKTKAKAKKRRR